MIMPAPFFPAPSQEYKNDRPLKRQELIDSKSDVNHLFEVK